MDLLRVIIQDNYGDYLNGKEVEATVVSEDKPVEKGMHVMGFHNSIAVNTTFTVPREKQTHYIGVEGMITNVDTSRTNHSKQVKVIKL